MANESQTRELSELFPRARIDVLMMTYGPRDRAFYSHGHQHNVYQQFELHWEGPQKMPLYCELLRRMMTDQVARIRDRGHQRKVNEQNGRDSVAMACAADALARHPSA